MKPTEEGGPHQESSMSYTFLSVGHLKESTITRYKCQTRRASGRNLIQSEETLDK
ncbi:MAG: hypothetical protein KAH48_07420 [Chlorobi bacterium]|nr:hypothetical protein [Chlorobiota bacterium]